MESGNIHWADWSTVQHEGGYKIIPMQGLAPLPKLYSHLEVVCPLKADEYIHEIETLKDNVANVLEVGAVVAAQGNFIPKMSLADVLDQYVEGTTQGTKGLIVLPQGTRLQPQFTPRGGFMGMQIPEGVQMNQRGYENGVYLRERMFDRFLKLNQVEKFEDFWIAREIPEYNFTQIVSTTSVIKSIMVKIAIESSA